jgi:Sulfate permease family
VLIIVVLAIAATASWSGWAWRTWPPVCSWNSGQHQRVAPRVAERSGAKTQLTGVTRAALIILMIVLIPSLFQNLPPPALAVLSVTSTGEREPLMISSASVFAECLPVNLRVPAA